MKTLKTEISRQMTSEKQSQVLSEMNNDALIGRLFVLAAIVLLVLAFTGIGNVFVCSTVSMICLFTGLINGIRSENESNYRPSHNYWGENNSWFKK